MTARVLVVDDEAAFRDLYARTLRDAGFEVETASSGEEALAAIERGTPDLVVTDVRMPGRSGLDLLERARARRPAVPFLLVTAYGDVREAVTALKLGAVDYLEKPIDLDELVAAAEDAAGTEPAGSGNDPPAEALRGIVAESLAMRAALRDAWRVAPSDATVLLLGESGTGKEVIARFIHGQSPRRGKPFVAVNCAALPDGLVASELFGHEKGAFTGAGTGRLGRFREATGGTLLLDEVGDLPLALQPALLRAIESRRVAPLGGTGEVDVDVRLIAATNRDLEREVSEGRFRADLFYRLNVIAITLPPLRERPEDILPLARLLLGAGPAGPKRLSPGAVRALESHAWPGNIRELANAMERARLLSRTDVVLPEHLPPALRPRSGPPPGPGAPVPPAGATPAVMSLERQEREAIERALRETGGNRTKAAEILGISRRTLLYRLKRFALGGPPLS